MPTCYASLSEPRAQLALATCRACAAEGLRLVVADDSPPGAGTAAAFAAAGASHVVVGGAAAHGGGKGGGIRAAIAHVVSSATPDDWAVLFTEPEKHTMAALAREIAAPILAGAADVVVPTRDPTLFAETYATEQFHSETFGNAFLNAAAREAGFAPADVDWFFGPFAFRAALADHWLRFKASDWTSQMVPYIRAAGGECRVATVAVAYRHPAEQKAEEEGAPGWCRKRLLQLNSVLPVLQAEFAPASRVPGALKQAPYQNELRVAVDLALRAGAAIRTVHEGGAMTSTTLKSMDGVDLVTKTDRDNEALVCAGIAEAFPTHLVIGEEAAADAGDIPPLTAAPTWIVDPIDGTTNFVNGLPLCCVSIGLCVNGRPVLGVVYDPAHDELYAGVEGHGAFCNGARIASSAKTALASAVVVHEFGYERTDVAVAAMLEATRRVLHAGTRALRQIGSGVLDLLWVASGRLDAVYVALLPLLRQRLTFPSFSPVQVHGREHQRLEAVGLLRGPGHRPRSGRGLHGDRRGGIHR